MNTLCSIVLADDHALMGDLLTKRLEAEPDLQLLCCVANAEAAVQAVRRLSPDIVVLDIDMPGMCVFEAIKTIHNEKPGTRSIILTAYCSDQYIHRALELEVEGYITKHEPLESVIEAIRRVAAGRVCFSRDVRARIEVHARGATLTGPKRSRIDLLTARETEVLGYIARGLAKKEVALLMNISTKTVGQHCTHVMTKLDIHDRVQLARFAIREGLVRP